MGLLAVACTPPPDATDDTDGNPRPHTSSPSSPQVDPPQTWDALAAPPGGLWGEAPTEPGTEVECFVDPVDPTVSVPDYDQFGPTLASHCSGTDHQDILDVERVVFLGDSITVGTPPTVAAQMYRNVLAAELATHFGLTPPDATWERVDLVNGTSVVEQSGDFWSCAEWGARTDDLIGDQIDDCFPDDQRHLRTLVVMTVGGNDFASLQEDFVDGEEIDVMWDTTEEFVGLLRDAMGLLTDPVEFPGGNYVIMANPYEYTDGTGLVTSCPAAALSGFEDTEQPELLEMVSWTLEEYMSIAVDTETDLLFLQEAFCGHGFMRDDPSSPCYQGPGAELWFDVSCTHPNPTGHSEVATMFGQIVLE